MINKGWIKLDRQIQDHWIWNDPEKLKAWLDLILLANYEDKKSPYKGSVITCKRGDVNLSISFLADRWGWSRKRTRAFIRTLEQDGMVTTRVSTHRTVITVENYGKYQDRVSTRVPAKVSTKEQQGYQQGSSKGTITKNNKEYIKEIKKSAPLNFDNSDEEDTWKGKPLSELSEEEYLDYLEFGGDGDV